MIGNEILRLFAVVIFVVGKASCQKEIKVSPKYVNNKDYVGSQLSKKYNFPWMVTLHHAPARKVPILQRIIKERVFGVGSIVSPRYVFVSMDTFVRRSKSPPHRPFFQLVGEIIVFSSGIWGDPEVAEGQLEEGGEPRLIWTSHLLAEELITWNGVDTSKAGKVRFREGVQPPLINEWTRSPFGFSMAIALLRVGRSREDRLASTHPGFQYTKIVLPVPLHTWAHPKDLLIPLAKVFERAEKNPSALECYVGGYRSGDYRLVHHQMVYVAFEDCQKVYCDYDQRACFKWPIKGVHACFRSITFTNPCWWDQGSALYCSHVYNSVIGILTSSPTCGYFGLPAVFTLIPYGMELLDGIAGPNEGYTVIGDDDRFLYTPGPNKQLFLFPAYENE